MIKVWKLFTWSREDHRRFSSAVKTHVHLVLWLHKEGFGQPTHFGGRLLPDEVLDMIIREAI